MSNDPQNHTSLGLIIAGAAAVTVIVGLLLISNLDRISAAFSGGVASGDAETETAETDEAKAAETQETAELSKLATDYNAALDDTSGADGYFLHDITDDGTPELFVRAGDNTYIYVDGESGAESIGFVDVDGNHWSYTRYTSFIFFDDGSWGVFGPAYGGSNPNLTACGTPDSDGVILLAGGITCDLKANSDGSYSILEYDGSLGATGWIMDWTDLSDRSAIDAL